MPTWYFGGGEALRHPNEGKVGVQKTFFSGIEILFMEVEGIKLGSELRSLILGRTQVKVSVIDSETHKKLATRGLF